MKIGIDPGNTGAIALLSNKNEFIEVVDMPIMAMGKKNQVNAVALTEIINSYKLMSEFNDEHFHAIVEHVQAMPGNGSASMFNFGMGFGVIQGVIAALGASMTLVRPQKWKKTCSLIGKDKDNARTLAQQLYPEASLARKKDIGRADAILIARYGLESIV